MSLLAAVEEPERVRGLVLEMPVLERAAPSVALTFVPLLLALRLRPDRLTAEIAAFLEDVWRVDDRDAAPPNPIS